jgi:hypothetical protein
MNGRQFLVEEVPVAAIANQLSQLPAQISSLKRHTSSNVVSAKRQLPPRRLGRISPKAIFVAKAGIPRKGFMLDYVTINGGFGTVTTLQGDTTYYVSSFYRIIPNARYTVGYRHAAAVKIVTIERIRPDAGDAVGYRRAVQEFRKKLECIRPDAGDRQAVSYGGNV